MQELRNAIQSKCQRYSAQPELFAEDTIVLTGCFLVVELLKEQVHEFHMTIYAEIQLLVLSKAPMIVSSSGCSVIFQPRCLAWVITTVSRVI
jgi:hypothetical protein